VCACACVCNKKIHDFIDHVDHTCHFLDEKIGILSGLEVLLKWYSAYFASMKP
jgi:hypothetical protein